MGLLNKSGIEYVDYGCNWRRGCAHDCAYCYMGDQGGMATRFDHLAPAEGWAASELRVDDPAQVLEEELRRRRTLLNGVIMLSTSHDPAMHEEAGRELRDIVNALAKHGLLVQALLLTKSPNRALRYVNEHGAQAGLTLGTSFTTMGIGQTQQYEPGTERPADRLAALMEAHQQGYDTWVSMEPPLPKVYLHCLIEHVFNLPFQPWIVLGKMNYNGPDPDLRAWSHNDHWAEDRDATIALLKAHGYAESLQPRSGGYWVKRELRNA